MLLALGAQGVALTARPPLLVCTTASSLEGVAFCRHALKNPGEYRVRALVRNPQSARAKTLADLGAEVCVADNHDVGSLERAFEGAHGVYATPDVDNSLAVNTPVTRANL